MKKTSATAATKQQSPQPAVSAETVAKQIIDLIDDDGPGLSEEREKRLSAKVTAILKAWQQSGATNASAKP